VKTLLNTHSNPRASRCLHGARVLRRDRARPQGPGRGVLSIIGDVLGGVALFAVLFGTALLSLLVSG
jgi:hypothetical protein